MALAMEQFDQASDNCYLFMYSIKHIYTGIVHNEIILILFYSVAMLLANSRAERVACPDNPSDRRDILYRANVTVVLCEDTDLIVLLLRAPPPVAVICLSRT